MDARTDAKPLTKDEFLDGMKSLSSHEKNKIMLLLKVSTDMYKLPMTSEELLQEIVCKVLEGNRHIPNNIPLILAIAKVGKSIAHGYSVSTAGKLTASQVIINDTEDETVQLIDSSQNVEDQVFEQQLLKRVVNMCKGDEDLCKLVLAKIEGFSATELRSKVFNGDDRLYERTRKRFQRKLTTEMLKD